MTDYRVLQHAVVGRDFSGEELRITVAFAPMAQVPEPGDVITAPVPWQARWLVRDVAQGDGFDPVVYVHGDPDETSYLWYDTEVVVESRTDQDLSSARWLTLGRFPAGSPERRVGPMFG